MGWGVGGGGWGVRHFLIIGSWGYATGWHFHARIDYNKVAFPIFEILGVRKFGIQSTRRQSNSPMPTRDV